MQFNLCIKMKANHGALVRMMSLVERRGYTIVAMSSYLRDSDSQFICRLSASGARGGEALIRQIEKLFDVSAVDFDRDEPTRQVA